MSLLLLDLERKTKVNLKESIPSSMSPLKSSESEDGGSADSDSSVDVSPI